MQHKPNCYGGSLCIALLHTCYISLHLNFNHSCWFFEPILSFRNKLVKENLNLTNIKFTSYIKFSKCYFYKEHNTEEPSYKTPFSV